MNFAKKMTGYGVGMIVLYLGLNHASAAGTLFTSGAQGVSTVTKTFQGR